MPGAEDAATAVDLASWESELADLLREHLPLGQMSKSPSNRFPVTVTQLPVTRFEICTIAEIDRPSHLRKVQEESDSHSVSALLLWIL